MDHNDRIAILEQQVQQLQQQVNALQQQLNATEGTVHSRRAPFKRLQPDSSSFQLENFIGLNLMHVVGIVVLVIGLSLGVKYAIDKELISEAARIALAAVAGGILYALSLWLKKNYASFSAILFSGAMATLYFTTYAACDYYYLLHITAAFVIMVAITVYTAFNAISYNRQEIAILGMTGAYAIPFLISRNQQADLLFLAYIFLINGGITFLAFTKAWRPMSILALLITWVLFMGWLYRGISYQQQPMALAFMAGYYLLFCASLLALPFKNRAPVSSEISLLLVIHNCCLYLASYFIFRFSAPAQGAFTYSSLTVQINPFTGFYTLFCLALAWIAERFYKQSVRLSKYLAVQGTGLLALFIYQYWMGVTVTLLWLALAIVLFIAGLAGKKKWPRIAAITLFGLTLFKLVVFDSTRFTSLQKTLCYILTGILLLLVSFFYQKFKQVLFPGKEEHLHNNSPVD